MDGDTSSSSCSVRHRYLGLHRSTAAVDPTAARRPALDSRTRHGRACPAHGCWRAAMAEGSGAQAAPAMPENAGALAAPWPPGLHVHARGTYSSLPRVLTVFLVPDSHKTGHGNLRCTARASAPSGACQAWAVAACLLVRGGSGQRSYLTRAAAGSQQPARQVQRQQQACTSGGSGGPGCPVNATAGCNLCTGAKGTYHPPRYMKRKKIRGKISEIAV